VWSLVLFRPGFLPARGRPGIDIDPSAVFFSAPLTPPPGKPSTALASVQSLLVVVLPPRALRLTTGEKRCPLWLAAFTPHLVSAVTDRSNFTSGRTCHVGLWGWLLTSFPRPTLRCIPLQRSVLEMSQSSSHGQCDGHRPVGQSMWRNRILVDNGHGRRILGSLPGNAGIPDGPDFLFSPEQICAPSLGLRTKLFSAMQLRMSRDKTQSDLTATGGPCNFAFRHRRSTVHGRSIQPVLKPLRLLAFSCVLDPCGTHPVQRVIPTPDRSTVLPSDPLR